MTDQLFPSMEQFYQAAKEGGLEKIGHGIEKESLRIDPTGHIAQTPHPVGLGSALTHPSITTDFSEALIEFISPVYHSPAQSLEFLADQHSFLFSQLDKEELLWTSSMPCILIDDENSIPLAEYGSSNIAKLKTLYRKGLGYRYGRPMQTIAGIHYNFSLPDSFWTHYQQQLGSTLDPQDFITDQYFKLIRNFRRYSWLLIYLFGASPAVCKSFIRDQSNHGLEDYDEATFYGPYATSLRMGDLGYTSQAQASLYVGYNNLEEYTKGLTQAITTPYPDYSTFTDDDSSHVQLNANILQIENEFYSTIRPKRVSHSGQRPIKALLDDGIEYIEVRLLDLNPFLPVGIDETQICFLNSFLLYCLLLPSPESNQDEQREIESNLKAVVKQGRNPDLMLAKNAQSISFQEWAEELLSGTMNLSKLLDELNDNTSHQDANNAQFKKVADSELTPSAQILTRMRELNTPYFTFAMNQSLANSDYFRARPLDSSKMAELARHTEESNHQKATIEANDELSFDEFLQKSNEL